MTDTLRKAAEQAREALKAIKYGQLSNTDEWVLIRDAIAALDAALAADAPEEPTEPKYNSEPDENDCWKGVERCTLPHCRCPELTAKRDQERRDQHEAFMGGSGDEVLD